MISQSLRLRNQQVWSSSLHAGSKNIRHLDESLSAFFLAHQDLVAVLGAVRNVQASEDW